MAFDGIVTKKVTEELVDLIDYKIDKIYQPDKNTIILGLYGNFTNLALLACISSNNYRIHLTTHPIKNPTIAPNFCMLLRKHIIGYKIKDIYSTFPERIVYIELENSENPDKPIKKTLIIELMGKHSNIIIVDANDIIIDAIRHTSIEENAQRDIYPTARYIKPVSNNYDFQNLKNYEYKDSKKLKIKTILAKNNCPKDYELTESNTENTYSLNYSLDDFYYKKESNELFTNYRNILLNIILSTLKKYEKRLTNIDDKLEECKGMEKYKLYGELITANLYHIPNYNTSEIELANYYDGNKIIKIPLDKKYSPQYNAKRFFKKYNKLKNALEIVGNQKKDTLQEIDYIESVVYELENCTTIEDVQQIYDEISENDIFKERFSKKSKNNKKTSKKPKKMTSNKFVSFNPLKYVVDGYVIFVGRNNKENDYLTNKFASKSDLWFHTKDIHGSHVILKTKLGEIIPENIIYEAAKLAATHSKAKNSSNIPVDYCQVQFVKKVPGNKPGLVTYRNNKTIYVSFGDGDF